ncbi:hypothetical protein [Streptomyces cremeus]|uniref:Uncharacterized protein n=1 Tax=Streptomyces cremeus TaxID=66881 RepID=A0ABV5PA30_STRCM
MVVDPYAAEAVVRTRPTGTGCHAAGRHSYCMGELPIGLADGRPRTLDPGELPRAGAQGPLRRP